MKPTFVQKLVIGCCLAVAAAIVRPAAAQANPDFDSVSWTAIGCDTSDLTSDTSPTGVDFTGDAGSSAAFYAFDADYLYFRYRMNGDPSGAHGFAQYSWTALMQVPAGNAFQYQYQLSLNGKDDTIEVWANTVASDIEFSPLFQDDSEVQLHTQSFAGLGRIVPAGSSFAGDPDYFVDFAFPVSVLVGEGVIGSADELADSLFFPATSTNPNNYNKGHLNCPFLPSTELAITKEAVPATPLLSHTTTEAGFVVNVTNVGGLAKGITIDDPALPTYLGNVSVSATSSDPSVTPVVVSTNPVRVRANHLPTGATITVEISGEATPTCADEDFTNVASAYAVNAVEVSAEAVMGLRKGGGGDDLCDGFDNDCDGDIDENTDASCDDGNPCTTESCNAGVCGSETIPGCVPCDDVSDCQDGNACTVEACNAGVCSNEATPGCVPCSTASECGDGSGCSTDTCEGGMCAHASIPGCVSCASVTDCNDSNGCSDDTCSAEGVCGHSERAGCVPCTTIADCDDQNACTADVCQADGSCGHVTIPGCKPCSDVSACGDGDECTTEACVAGRCEYTESESVECVCTPSTEVCGDGTDNDCDGTTDCDDANCSAAPGCAAPAEVCGDCLDNDFDGLVDYEDGDCCAEEMKLGLRRMTLKTKTVRTRGNGLRIKARNLSSSRASFDPARQDTTLQVSDETGQLFCTTVAAKNWKKKGKKSFRFRDKKGTFAGGLKKGRFKVKKNGQIVFRTNGKKMSLRTPAKPKVDVTLRVGGACWQAPATLRKKNDKATTLTAP